MIEELVGEGAELGSKGEKMIVIFHLGAWYTEEWQSGDKLEDETAETPDINGIVDGSGKNQLGSSKAAWSNGLCRRVGKKTCYPGQLDIRIDIRQEKGIDNQKERD